MNKAIELLIKLQDEIIQENKLIKQNEEIPITIKDLEQKLSDSKDKLAKAEAAQKENMTSRLSLEQDIKMTEEKKKKLQEQLMVVKDNAQYKATTKSIDFCDKEVTSFEEKILVLMEEEDSLNNNLKEAKAALDRDNTKIQEEEGVLRKVAENNTKEIEKIVATQKELRKQIEDDVLKRFDTLASKKPWLGISGIRDDMYCSVCRFKIRPQVFTELISDNEIHVCDNCQRILYYIPPEINEE